MQRSVWFWLLLKNVIPSERSVTRRDSKMAESTFIMIKPDGVQRGLCGEIVRRFEARGLKLAGLKLKVPTPELAAEHYIELVNNRADLKRDLLL